MPTRPSIHRPSGFKHRSDKKADSFYLSLDWKALRKAVMERDGYRCTAVVDGRRCLHRAKIVHHVLPRKSGGADVMGNLVALCAAHHEQAHPNRYGRE
jgi:5-methylcytosine-specific restriction endonuclease McrA